jgi:hypothetical protein
MKNIVKILAAMTLFLSISCKAQQMVQVPADVSKLKANEQQFINRPLTNVLKEIKPEIKFVLGTVDSPSYFSFRFVSRGEFATAAQSGAPWLHVYVKEPLDWSFEKRPKGKEYEWTKEDAERYGNLTVMRIKITGK